MTKSILELYIREKPKINMSWKEKLKKIKTEAQASKEKQKDEASALASRVGYWIEKAEDLAKEFAQVSKAKARLFNLRHKEIDELTGKKYYTGGVILEITKQKSSLLNWLKPDEPAEKLIAQIEFPHPEAIKRLEGYEDKIKIIYYNSEKEITFKDFNLELLKTHLEEAYSCYLAKTKK